MVTRTRSRLAMAVWLAAWMAAASLPAAARQAETPADLLVTAVDTTLAFETMHFALENSEGSTEVFSGVDLERVEGEIQQPDRFAVTIEVEALLATVEIEAIGIGETFWVRNPLQGGDGYLEGEIDPDLLALARPDVIVRAIPEIVTDVEVTGQEDLDGEDTTVLSGVLDLERIEEVAPSLPTGSIELGNDLPVRIWIDGESLIRQIEITGAFVSQDDDNVVRVIELSEFGEPVQIEAP